MVDRERRSLGVPDWGPVGRAMLCGAAQGSIACAVWSGLLFMGEFFHSRPTDWNWVQRLLKGCGFALATALPAFFVIFAALCVVGLPIHAMLFANSRTDRRIYRLAGSLSGVVVGVAAGLALTWVWRAPLRHRPEDTEGMVVAGLVVAGWFVSCAVLAGWIAADRCWLILRPDLRVDPKAAEYFDRE